MAGEPRPVENTRPLRVTFFGVSTLLIEAGEDQLLVDGFFTRPRFLKSVLSRLAPDQGMIAKRLDRNGVMRLHAILTAHAHHDHALDTAMVAKIANERMSLRGDPAVTIVGTASTVNLMRASKLSLSAVIPPSGVAQDFGPFQVTAYVAPHGPALPFVERLLSGTISPDANLPLSLAAHKDTSSLSYFIEYGDTRIFISPSAGAPNEQLRCSDVVFLGIGGGSRLRR